MAADNEAIELIKSNRTAVVVLRNVLKDIGLELGAKTAEEMIEDIDLFLKKNDKK